MIRRRYPVILGALAVALAVLAAISTAQAAQLADRFNEWFAENTGPTTIEDMNSVYRMGLLTEGLQRLAQWAVLGACVAAVAALVLLVLRSRAQAGSASASASREASAAFSRS